MKKVMAILILIAVVCVIASPAQATGGFKKGAKDTGRAIVNYPANVVKDSVDVVGKAGVGTVETAVSPLVALWRSIIGKGKPEAIIVDPINKGGKTIKDATVGTVVTPYNAGKKTIEQNK
jgi:hypothetical protein